MSDLALILPHILFFGLHWDHLRLLHIDIDSDGSPQIKQHPEAHTSDPTVNSSPLRYVVGAELHCTKLSRSTVDMIFSSRAFRSAEAFYFVLRNKFQAEFLSRYLRKMLDADTVIWGLDDGYFFSLIPLSEAHSSNIATFAQRLKESFSFRARITHAAKLFFIKSHLYSFLFDTFIVTVVPNTNQPNALLPLKR